MLAGDPDIGHLCLFAHPINRIDATGVETFGHVRALLESRGIHLHISGLKLPVERVLRKAGVLAEGPLLSVYRTDGEALESFRSLVAQAQGLPQPNAQQFAAALKP